MNSRPRVFLSHSKADLDFIGRLYEDLRACQIEPWYDTFDIRHGQPWIDAIFEGGIPSCDCVLVYLTEHSIESQVVKKEIDAGIIQQLKDRRVGLLPYVSSSALRSRLRGDIQSLQVPEWNNSNYNVLLPRVVAEIWHLFCDRSIASATNDEKVRRLEAELQVKNLAASQDATIFSTAEDKDFQFIYSRLNYVHTISVVKNVENEPDRPTEEKLEYSVNVLSLYHSLFEEGFYHYDDRYLNIQINKALMAQFVRTEKESFYCATELDLTNDLLMYGLIQKFTYAKTERGIGLFTGDGGYRTKVDTRHEFTPKMHRFRYWMVLRELSPSKFMILPNQAMEPTVASV